MFMVIGLIARHAERLVPSLNGNSPFSWEKKSSIIR